MGPCGILFPNDNAEAMAWVLKDLITNPSLREKLMKQSLTHLERFRPELVAQKYLDAFQSVLHK
jgi:glycosyltransferase involved in cell wall biosynthesis